MSTLLPHRPFRARHAAARRACALAAGCASPGAQDHAGRQPHPDLRRYLEGPLTAHGIFTDRSGRVVGSRWGLHLGDGTPSMSRGMPAAEGATR